MNEKIVVIQNETENISTGIEYKNILCAFCLFRITSDEFSFFVNSQHEYEFKNPANILFQIRLFSKADGCIDINSPSLQFTWFPNFAWNFALCLKCKSHLGWKYHSESNSFFGLISDRIIKE